MVQAKFGIPQVAQRQLEIFSTAVLLATESPPPHPRKPEWRAIMDQLSATSCRAYRSVRLLFQSAYIKPSHAEFDTS